MTKPTIQQALANLRADDTVRDDLAANAAPQCGHCKAATTTVAAAFDGDVEVERESLCDRHARTQIAEWSAHGWRTIGIDVAPTPPELLALRQRLGI